MYFLVGQEEAMLRSDTPSALHHHTTQWIRKYSAVNSNEDKVKFTYLMALICFQDAIPVRGPF